MDNFNNLIVVIATHIERQKSWFLSEESFLNNENIAVSSRTYYWDNCLIIPIGNHCIYHKHDTKISEHCRFLLYDRVMFRESDFVYKFSKIEYKGVNEPNFYLG